MRRTYFSQVVRDAARMTHAQVDTRLQNAGLNMAKYDPKQAAQALLAVCSIGQVKNSGELSRFCFKAEDEDGNRLGDVLAAEIEAHAGLDDDRDVTKRVTGMMLYPAGAVVMFGCARRAIFGLAGPDQYFTPCKEIPPSIFRTLGAVSGFGTVEPSYQSAIEARRKTALFCAGWRDDA